MRLFLLLLLLYSPNIKEGFSQNLFLVFASLQSMLHYGTRPQLFHLDQQNAVRGRRVGLK